MRTMVATIELHTLYEKGWSLNEIGEHFNLTGQTIYCRFKNAGIKLRTISEAQKLAYKRGRMKSQSGPDNNQWKGGRYYDSRGYVYVPDPKRKRRKKFEHRAVWEEHIGKIPKDWVVHHLNGIRDDNRIENLAAMPRKKHSPMSIVEPYIKRICELERQLKEVRKLIKK